MTAPKTIDGAMMLTDEQIRKSMTPAQIQLERKLTCEAIDGAIAFGYQNTNPPPSDDHWLAPFWKIGRKQAELELLFASKPAAPIAVARIDELWEQINDMRANARADRSISIAVQFAHAILAEHYVPGRKLVGKPVFVSDHDANAYCAILRILGMEEEGDPAQEVERLKALDTAAPAQSGEPIYQEWIGSAWVDVDDVQYAGALMDKRRIVYAAPQPTEPAKAGEALYTQADMERYGKCYADARDCRRTVVLDGEQAAFERIGYATLHEGTVISVRLDEPMPTDFINGYSGADVFIARAASSQATATQPAWTERALTGEDRQTAVEAWE